MSERDPQGGDDDSSKGPAALSADQAERLAKEFRAIWEVDEEAGTDQSSSQGPETAKPEPAPITPRGGVVPAVAPKAPAVASRAPEKLRLEPAAPAKRTLLGFAAPSQPTGIEPWVESGGPLRPQATPDEVPKAVESPQSPGSIHGPTTMPSPGVKQTLLGLAPAKRGTSAPSESNRFEEPPSTTTLMSERAGTELSKASMPERRARVEVVPESAGAEPQTISGKPVAGSRRVVFSVLAGAVVTVAVLAVISGKKTEEPQPESPATTPQDIGPAKLRPLPPTPPPLAQPIETAQPASPAGSTATPPTTEPETGAANRAQSASPALPTERRRKTETKAEPKAAKPATTEAPPKRPVGDRQAPAPKAQKPAAGTQTPATPTSQPGGSIVREAPF
ncbi:MAG TPA: hypothetical protein VGJ84_18465 [Polyangiaceae bacterium]